MLGAYWGPLKTFCALLGRLEPSWGVLGSSWSVLDVSWVVSGAVMGRLLGALKPSWSVLKASRVFFGSLEQSFGRWAPWDPLKAFWALLGRLEPYWGAYWRHLEASLKRFWAAYWASRSLLGAC